MTFRIPAEYLEEWYSRLSKEQKPANRIGRNRLYEIARDPDCITEEERRILETDAGLRWRFMEIKEKVQD